MLTWLADEPTTAYLLLGVLALSFGMGWWTSRQRRYAIAFGFTLAFMFMVWLTGRLVITDARRVRDAVRAMADAVAERRADLIFTHVSNDFRLGRCGKEDLRGMVEHRLRNGDLVSLGVRDLSVQGLSRENRTATVRFTAFPSGPDLQGTVYRCEARFVLDPDGQWRLQTFRLSYPPLDPSSSNSLVLPISC